MIFILLVKSMAHKEVYLHIDVCTVQKFNF